MGGLSAGRAANHYGLVILLVAFSYVVAASWSHVLGMATVVVVQLVTIWLVYTVSESARARRVAEFAVALAAVVALVSIAGGALVAQSSGNDVGEFVSAVLAVLLVVLYGLSPILILGSVLRRRVVDVQTLFGAIAAYLLIGMTYAFAYIAVSKIQGAPPFFGEQGEATAPQSLFFSFTTLTTTGYGNLVPASNPGQTMAISEVVIGQMFLVTAVAKIVADYSLRNSADS